MSNITEMQKQILGIIVDKIKEVDRDEAIVILSDFCEGIVTELPVETFLVPDNSNIKP